MKSIPKISGAYLATSVVIFTVGFTAGALSVRRSLLLPGDWMSFAGALLGAAVTVAGSVYVLEHQRNQKERDEVDLLRTLLDDVVQACLPFQVANQAALVARFGKTAKQQVAELESAISRLQTFGSRMEPRTIRVMKIQDAIAGLSLPTGELQKQAKACGLYPDSADFGGLNAIGHEITTEIVQIHDLM